MESRTVLWAFRDYATIEAVPNGDGALVRAFARQELGGYDWGVNRRRLERWFRAAGLAIP